MYVYKEERKTRLFPVLLAFSQILKALLRLSSTSKHSCSCAVTHSRLQRRIGSDFIINTPMAIAFKGKLSTLGAALLVMDNFFCSISLSFSFPKGSGEKILLSCCLRIFCSGSFRLQAVEILVLLGCWSSFLKTPCSSQSTQSPHFPIYRSQLLMKCTHKHQGVLWARDDKSNCYQATSWQYMFRTP